MIRPTIAIAAALAAPAALAQSGDVSEQTQDVTEGAFSVEAGTIALADWDVSKLYDGGSWSVEALTGIPVTNPDGEAIGQVEDLVLRPDGTIASLIAQVGGTWDIGDVHVSVPWDKANLGDDAVTVPVTEETVTDFDLFADADLSMAESPQLGENLVTEVDGESLGLRAWRASELIGEYVRVRSEERENPVEFGLVDDILIEDGQIAATIVSGSAGVGGGLYATPYDPETNPAAGGPTAPTLDLPYLVGDMQDVAGFDRERYEDSRG